MRKAPKWMVQTSLDGDTWYEITRGESLAYVLEYAAGRALWDAKSWYARVSLTGLSPLSGPFEDMTGDVRVEMAVSELPDADSTRHFVKAMTRWIERQKG